MKNIRLATILILSFATPGLACDYTELKPDPNGPYGCAGFLQCANGEEFQLPCQPNTYFNYDKQWCDGDTLPSGCKVLTKTPTSAPATVSPTTTTTTAMMKATTSTKITTTMTTTSTTTTGPASAVRPPLECSGRCANNDKVCLKRGLQ